MKKKFEKCACKQKATPKFGLQNSLMHNGKGKTISNLSDPIHSGCNLAITTQEGSNAAQE